MGKEKGKVKGDMESRLENALRSRLPYFNEHADTLSMLNVRRMLEEDLELEKFALDVHKRFIKQFVEKWSLSGWGSVKLLTRPIYSSVDDSGGLKTKTTAICKFLMHNHSVLKSWPSAEYRAVLFKCSHVTMCHDCGSKNFVEHAGKSSNSTAAVKESSKDCGKDDQLKAPSSKDDRGSIDKSPVEPKIESDSVQNTDLSESAIKKAILERVDHFRANFETLSLVAARRLLEGDLGLKRNALDPFKKFIRKEMEEVLGTQVVSESSSIDSSKDVSGDCPVKATDTSGSKERADFRDKHKDRVENLSEPCTKDEQQVDEDSPIYGLLTSKVDLVNAQGIETSESTIKKAILDRAHHFRANAETLTLAGSRRFLEEQLGLPKNALDPFKKFISKQIEEILDSPAADVKKAAQAMEPKKSNQLKRHRSPESEAKSGKKLKKVGKKKPAGKSNSDEGRGSSEDGGSQTSAGKADKKNVATTPAYGKRVEHLKSIIKACGMSVPPSVYKKAKQVSDGKREAYVIKELEDILSREGLSENPTDKEIKEVKKRKERAKELEGIDLSNIVTSGRRRSAASFASPSYFRREGKDGDKAKVSTGDNTVKKIDKKSKGSSTKDNDIKNGDKKVEKASGVDRKDEDVAKQEKEEEVKGEKGGGEEEGEEAGEVEEEEDEDDGDKEEEEDNEEDSDDFNEDDSDDSD